MNFNNPYFIATALLSVINLALMVLLYLSFRKYQGRQAELLKGEETPDIESIVLGHKKKITTLTKNLKELGEIMEQLVEENKFNIQKIGMVRFNPFSDTGGNMSFAIALLDANDDGIVISSLHGREVTRIYSKEVKARKSKARLTGEEERAIASASSRM